METKIEYAATVDGTTILEVIQVVACLAGIIVLVVAATIGAQKVGYWAMPLFAVVFAARLVQMRRTDSTLELEFTYTRTEEPADG